MASVFPESRREQYLEKPLPSSEESERVILGAILLASLTAGTIGFIWLKLFGKPEEFDEDMDAMDFDETETP